MKNRVKLNCRSFRDENFPINANNSQSIASWWIHRHFDCGHESTSTHAPAGHQQNYQHDICDTRETAIMNWFLSCTRAPFSLLSDLNNWKQKRPFVFDFMFSNDRVKDHSLHPLYDLLVFCNSLFLGVMVFTDQHTINRDRRFDFSTSGGRDHDLM